MPVSLDERYLHSWDVTPREAIAIQERLRGFIVTADDLPPITRVAGIDVGFEDHKRVTRAAVAVLSFPDLTRIEQSVARLPTRFPYVPGLLSFREIPAVLEALDGLSQPPDLLLYDGQGIAHPRRMGIASHTGLITGIPSIGVAKSRLIGEHEEPGVERGAWAPLTHKDELIGAVLRTRRGVKPLYVSCGHRVSLPTAIELVLACTPRYRLPETTRWAHSIASG